MMRANQRDECRKGVHRPKPASKRRDGDLQRSVCRGCGCTLVRTQATRRWFLSGVLA
jgi:hypothetical protein